MNIQLKELTYKQISEDVRYAEIIVKELEFYKLLIDLENNNTKNFYEKKKLWLVLFETIKKDQPLVIKRKDFLKLFENATSLFESNGKIDMSFRSQIKIIEKKEYDELELQYKKITKEELYNKFIMPKSTLETEEMYLKYFSDELDKDIKIKLLKQIKENNNFENSEIGEITQLYGKDIVFFFKKDRLYPYLDNKQIDTSNRCYIDEYKETKKYVK